MSNIANKLKDNVLLFGKIVMPKTFYVNSPEFHKEITKSLEDTKCRYLNIIAPRGSAKSSLVAGVYVLHHLMFSEGQKLILLTSRTQYHAILLLQYIKDILDYSPEFRAIFGYWGQQSAKKWTGTEIVLKDGSAIVCKGTGQQVRGIKYGNQRPTLAIIDDPEDENNTKTSEAMESNLRWLLQSVVPSVDSHKGRIIVIGTPLHERCMVLTLKSVPSWKSLHYKYINTDENGKEYSLWEEMKSLDTLKSIKKDHEEIGRLSVFYKEYQCEVIGDEDRLFSADYIKYYDGELVIEDKETFLNVDGKKKRVNVSIGIDPASSTSAHADFSVIMPVAIDSDENKYILPYFRKRVTPLVLADEIIAYYKKLKPIKTRIESSGYQDMLRQYIRKECEREKIYISGLDIKETPRASKSYRLESMQPDFARGKIFMKRNMQELQDELLLYPRGKHDDLLDGLYYALKNTLAPSEEKEVTNKISIRNLRTLSDWLVS